MKKSHRVMIMLAAVVLVVAIIGGGVLQRVDKWAQDALFQRPGMTSTDIVIIGIDEEALQEQGPWPWSRDVIADALCVLASDPEHKPAVVAIDIVYAGASSDPGADAYLAGAAGLLENVITASMAEFGEEITWEDGRAVSSNGAAIVGYVLPFEALEKNTIQGHINAMLDRDGILRHALLYVEPAPGTRVYSMAYEAARLFLERQGKQIGMPPVNAAGHFYVPYSAEPGAYYDGVSVSDLVNGRIPSEYWDGKIVLIGPYAVSLQDTYFTSINKAAPMYGVEYQANVIQSLVDGVYKTEVDEQLQLMILLGLCAAAAILFILLRVGPGGIVCIGMTILGTGGCIVLYLLGYVAHPLWLAIAVPALYVVSLAIHYAVAAMERQALALKEERLNAELSLATRIQANALPKTFPPFPERSEFDLYASMTPAKEVGGDLYDFFLLDEDHLCLVIGDVSGKGVPASLFMMMSIMLFHHVAMREKKAGRILQVVNDEICSRNPEEMFVTVWVGILEISTGKLTAANAGHEYPAVKKAGGHFELLKDRHGLVIGGMDGARYREYEIRMDPGDKLFLYTDGVAEATDAAEQMYGTGRMIETLCSCEGRSPREILEGVDASVKSFVGSAPQFDDLTMMCLEYRGPVEKTNDGAAETEEG